jgi:hypothetical protein
MLLVSLVGSIITRGLLYPIVHLIGLAEGIIYLSKTDDDVLRTCVDGRRESLYFLNRGQMPPHQ